MLRPRDDDDQRLLQSDLEITPKPRELAWGRDRFGNHVAIAHFALRFVSTVHLEYAPNGFHEGDIEDYARNLSFQLYRGGLVAFRRRFGRVDYEGRHWAPAKEVRPTEQSSRLLRRLPRTRLVPASPK